MCRPYSEHKGSGVDWIGEIPRAWDVARLRYLASIETGSRDTVDAEAQGIFPFFVRSQTVEAIDTFSFDCEAVLTAGDGVGVGKVFHHFTGKFEAHQRVYVMRKFKRITGRFFYYYFQSLFSKVALDGGAKSTVDSLRRPMLADFPICVPPSSEQKLIVEYLDRETAQIDDLIGKQERLIELLAEKRQAIISHAVTKGLDPTARAKPSGIPWLGDIPAHWTASQLGTWLVHKIEGGYSPTASGIFPEEEDWGVLSLGAVGRGVFLPGNVKSLDPSADIPTSLEIRDGDLLLTRSNVRERVGFAAVVERSRPQTIFPDLVYRLAVNSSMDKQYLACFLSSTPARAQIESSARGSSGTMPKISHDQIRAWRIPLPPLSEQQELVAFVRSKCARIDRVSLDASNAIGLLQERRSALISAAVTGKIDVREGAA
jgi:type I restriction enzyme S subunit